MVSAASVKRTPLHPIAAELGARFVEFAGWEMPVQFTGAIEEHMAVRQAVGLFDVSHMGRFELRGPDALPLIQKLTSNDAARLADHQVQYSTLTTERGTIIDDITIYRMADDRFFLCVNAANRQKDHQQIASHIGRLQVQLEDVSDKYAQIALQGPAAESVLQELTPVELRSIKFYRFSIGDLIGVRSIISRTGYTGEDGFELYVPSPEAPRIWRVLMEKGAQLGIRACGLAARNTLRLEARMMLYGNDINESTTVLEAGLGWILKFDKGDFLGCAELLRQQEEGVRTRLVGFEVLDRAPARDHYPVHWEGRKVAEVTSGSFAPFLRKNIGLAYLPIEACRTGTRIAVEVRGRELPAEVVDTPFYRRKK